jgi:hypothetical protein
MGSSRRTEGQPINTATGSYLANAAGFENEETVHSLSLKVVR